MSEPRRRRSRRTTSGDESRRHRSRDEDLGPTDWRWLAPPFVYLLVLVLLECGMVLTAPGPRPPDVAWALAWVAFVGLVPPAIVVSYGWSSARIVAVRRAWAWWAIAGAVGLPWLVAVAWAAARSARDEAFATELGLIGPTEEVQLVFWLIAMYAAIPPTVIAFFAGRAAVGSARPGARISSDAGDAGDEGTGP